MSEFSKEYFMQQLSWRYAVKKFDAGKKISTSDWEFLEEVLRLSPSSFGLQPWKFLIVQNPEMRKKLTTATWGQKQVEDCSHFVVLTTLKKIDVSFIDKYLKSIADTRGVPIGSLEAFKKNIVNTWVTGPRQSDVLSWTQRQVYIAMGNLMNAAAMLKIDTTPMEGLEPAKYDEILNLNSTDFSTVAAVACGYRSGDDELARAKKVRFSKSEVFQII